MASRCNHIYSKCSNLVTPQPSLYGVFHKESACFGNSYMNFQNNVIPCETLHTYMEPNMPNTVFGRVFERTKYGQVRYP